MEANKKEPELPQLTAEELLQIVKEEHAGRWLEGSFIGGQSISERELTLMRLGVVADKINRLLANKAAENE